MGDPLSKEQRSYCMSCIKGKNTKPELIVRKLVFALGFRYRLHGKGLPGRPDLVFSGRRKVIFVHGCFWHRHACRHGVLTPKNRIEFWQQKFAENKKRDRRNYRQLRKMGYQVLVVWECQLGNKEKLVNLIYKFLRSTAEEH